jgi:hypothetical protein
MIFRVFFQGGNDVKFRRRQKRADQRRGRLQLSNKDGKQAWPATAAQLNVTNCPESLKNSITFDRHENEQLYYS